MFYVKGKILRVKYGYNPNSSSVGSATSGLMAESLKNAINSSKTNSSVLADLLGINISKTANATTTTTLTQSTTGSSWLMGGGVLDTLIYVVSAAITSVIIYFTAKKIARAIRKKLKR
jgi:hypothetical protein